MRCLREYARIAVATWSRDRSGPLHHCESIRLLRIELREHELIMTIWSIYLLRCADGSHYTGIATDVSRRLAEHTDGEKGAKYLRGRGPLELIYHQEIGDQSLATKIELQVKRFPKAYKEDLGALPGRIEELMKQFALQSA